jgi:uncharacterized 2Fe-2S/4Fe-4S cluster protein (DUF4445 family)
MGQCACHPAIETRFLCMKHHRYLCEECLKCQDPELYCKFRSACPIWFLEKKGAKELLSDDGGAAEALQTRVVSFLPDNTTVNVLEGTTLLEAAQRADVYINSSCNGKGACGKCKLIIESGETDSRKSPLLSDQERQKNYVLACQTRIKGDVCIRIPAEAMAKKLKVVGMAKEATGQLRGTVAEITPMLTEIVLDLNPPTLEDSVSDLDRLNRALKKNRCDVERMTVGLKVMRELAAALRDENWRVTAAIVHRKCSNEVLSVTPGNGNGTGLGLAVDLGTTSIVVYLVDMSDGSVLAVTSAHNRQAICGDDVINRMICAEKEGVQKLSRMALHTINSLIEEALEGAGAKPYQIKNVVASGNTTMTHLLLQIDPRYIRREPYIPTVSEFPIFKAGEIGLKANAAAAVFIMPGPASYVGGDIVAGLLYSGLQRQDQLTLFIDVGTNGEIVLGNRDWLMTAACSAGPAFEGGGVRWGMRAEEGAIEKVSIDPSSLEPAVSVIGEKAPRGICGSGMIDLISEMLTTGIIDRSGKFSLNKEHARIDEAQGEAAYIVVFARDTAMGEDIIFTESDIKNLILSKAAVYAGFQALLKQAGLDFSMVERIQITGGFGRYLNIEKAVTIGLLPDVERCKFEYLGNSSIAGSYLALLSEKIRKEALQVCNAMTYIDFSTNHQFMDEFTSALFLPHTNLNNFPSVVPK